MREGNGNAATPPVGRNPLQRLLIRSRVSSPRSRIAVHHRKAWHLSGNASPRALRPRRSTGHGRGVGSGRATRLDSAGTAGALRRAVVPTCRASPLGTTRRVRGFWTRVQRWRPRRGRAKPAAAGRGPFNAGGVRVMRPEDEGRFLPSAWGRPPAGSCRTVCCRCTRSR